LEEKMNDELPSGNLRRASFSSMTSTIWNLRASKMPSAIRNYSKILNSEFVVGVSADTANGACNTTSFGPFLGPMVAIFIFGPKWRQFSANGHL
jgi:hypothetical protein